MSDIDATIIKRTQETLGKYLKKPALSEKLLKKPPFRFLHDVFHAVIRDTGYLEGLYSVEELNHENITDRDGKMKFLQKMIDAIKLITNEPLSVRTSKIVAGHEPEKTNELLQFIGIAIEKKLDWKKAVAQINKTDESPSSTKQKTKEKDVKEKKSLDKSPKVVTTKKVETSKEKIITDIKEKVRSKELKEKNSRKPSNRVAENEKKVKNKSPNKEPSKKISSKKLPTENVPQEVPRAEITEQPNTLQEVRDDQKKTDVPKMIKENILKQTESFDKEQVLETSGDVQKVDIVDDDLASKRAEEILLTVAAEDNNDGNTSRRSSGSKRSSGRTRRSAEKSSRKSKTEDGTTQHNSADPVDILKTVAEESAAEVLPPKPQPSSPPNSDVKRETTFVREDSKDSNQGVVARPRTSLRPPSARPASARPGAPRRRDKNIEIVLQPNDQIKLSGISVKLETFNSELEDDGENLVIIENPNTDDRMETIINKNNYIIEDDTQQQGHLVQQILETQKELVQGSSPDTEQKRDSDIDISKMNSRQSSARQMNSLRDVIQNLTKSVNPLGKLMDFIPEDIDAMQLELAMWRDTYNQSSIELKKERSLTESVTEPMKNQLVTIEANIKEYRDMIDACRAKILQNAEKIQRLLTTQ